MYFISLNTVYNFYNKLFDIVVFPVQTQPVTSILNKGYFYYNYYKIFIYYCSVILMK